MGNEHKIGNKPSNNGTGDQDAQDAVEGNGKWTPEQWMFIEWTATPSYEQDPTTEKALAERLDISDRTLRNWKKKEGFWNEVRTLCRSHLEEHITEVYHALVQEAKKGSITHIKLYLELIGEYAEHYDFTTGGQPFPVHTFDYAATIAQITPNRE